MIQVQRHIEILLLSHDCVIIPGFGGFIAHHEDARYDEADRLFLPPYRTLGFNPQLTLNDSLLAQSYVEAYDISYPDALRQIEAEVEELKKILSTEGEYMMEGLGRLSVNVEGHYEFEPCEAGILTPEVYGLADFHFKRLKDVELAPAYVADNDQKTESVTEPEAVDAPSEAPAPALLDFTDDEDDNDNRALVVKMSWVRNAVAIAAAVACFFLMATPVANSDLGDKAMTQLQNNIIYKLMPKDSNMMPAQPVVAKQKVEEQKAVDEQKVVEEEQKVVEEEQKVVEEQKVAETAPAKAEETDTYCIVLASQVKRSNAEEYVEKLKQQNIADARIYVKGNILRVVCGSFNNQQDAYNHLNQMADNEEFAEAWVLKMKNEE